MTSKQEILALVQQYVDKKKSLDEFSQTFAEIFYDIDETGTLDAVQLANEIEAALAAGTAGLNSESDLRVVLTSLLPSETGVVIVESKPISNKEINQMIVSCFTCSDPAGASGKGSLVFAGIALSAGFSSAAFLPETRQTSTLLFQSQLALEAR